MQFYERVSGIIAGTAITSAIVITLPQTAQALTGEEVNNVAREITVLIRGDNGSHGSGFIVSKSDKTYYVLTAFHVVSGRTGYKLVTIDQQAYQLDSAKIKRLPGVDLAIVEFNSNKEYKIAKLANSDTVTQGKPVFVSGWPRLTAVGQAAGGGLVRQFTDGRVSGFLPKAYEGYQMSYTNITLAGMSGGPVLDAGGRVVGVHGLGDNEDPKILMRQGFSEDSATSIAGLIKPGFNYAIPINTFLQLAPQSGLYMALQVENSPASELGAPYVASGQHDKRDTIDDINSVLNNVNRIIEPVNRIRRFLPF